MKLLQNSGIPIYQQIADAFREEIMSGKRKSGEYLPSIRGLAKELRISVITTIKAYEELECEGLVTAVQGKGYYVNEQDTEMLHEQHMRKVEEHLNNAITAARVAGINNKELVGMLKILLEQED